MRAIEDTGTLNAQGHIQLDHPLPQGKASRVRVILLIPEEDELNEQTWLSAISTNPSFAYLHDPEEDIYTLEDGQSVNYPTPRRAGAFGSPSVIGQANN
ncbi:MAG: hypothetical protein AB4372_18865 [Xenococcus sp. (in: cyanobacteria)]